MENEIDIFNFFQNSETYFCQVMQYWHSHGKMLLQVHKNQFKEHFFVIFDSVQYYEGPMGWAGANFHIGTERELSEAVKKSGFGEENLLFFLENYLLYKVGFAPTEAKFLARKKTHIKKAEPGKALKIWE